MSGKLYCPVSFSNNKMCMAQPIYHPFFASSRSILISHSNISKLNININNNACLLFHPLQKSVVVSKKWSIHALDFSFSKFSNLEDDELGVEFPAKLKILKHVLMRETGDWGECLNLIDAAQRLGIDYHFQEEIEFVLQRQYHLCNIPQQSDQEMDLHKVALVFRLLRQQGFFVTSGVFKIFLDEKGNFDEKLRQDINGVTSLYEASQLRMDGDDILEEAENFSSNTLNSCAAHVYHHHVATFVHNTLAHPRHKSVPQFMVPIYFGHTQWTNKWLNILQDVARADFISTQRLRQNEIAQFLKWWKETNLGKEMNFARDQPIKWYVGSLVCLADPCYSEERVQLAKSISFIYLIDDLFDVFGTVDELTCFTEAVIRWDLAAAERLPNCMKICFKSLFEVTNEISYKISNKHGWNPIGSFKKAWAKLCKAFLVEAEWLSCGHSPSAEEYLKNGIVSTGVNVILVHVFFLLGQQISNQTVELLDNDDLDIISSSAMILRLWDDMGSAKDEEQEGRDGSYIEYYMKEHPSISHEGTQQHIMKKISEAWKTLNREHFLSNNFPTNFTQASLNIARAVPLAYNYGRNQSIMTLDKLMDQLLFNSVEI